MRYVHLMFNSVFCLPCVNFINEHFGEDLHVFFIRDNAGYVCQLPTANNVLNISHDIIENSEDFLVTLHKAKKIFLHGMFHDDYIDVLLQDDSLAKKTTWLVWGGDLTDLEPMGNRGILAKKFCTIGTSERDYEMAQAKYQTQGDRKDFLYPSVYDLTHMQNILQKKRNTTTINIMVGNSASASFRHVEVFEMLKKAFSNEQYTIYSPLSYGEHDYAACVVSNGKRLFNDNFIPLMKFMEPTTYNAFLSKIDVALFPQIRSQALNTMFALSYFGTKIYCKTNTTHYIQLEYLGIIVENIDTIDTLPFANLVIHKNCLHNHYNGKKLIDNCCQKEIWKNLLFC